MRCASCGNDKPTNSFTLNQRKKSAGLRKCSACAAAAAAASAAGNPAARPVATVSVGATTCRAHVAGTARGADPPGPETGVHAAPSNTAATTGAETSSAPAPTPAPRVCSWAGCGRTLVSSKNRCGGCKRAFYCARACQKKHWKEGGHRRACQEPPCCTICLDGGDDPLPIKRGCGCRGDAGLAHVGCLAEANTHKMAGFHEGWHTCSTCMQHYTGSSGMQLGLAQDLERRLRPRPRRDHDRMCAVQLVGNALMQAGKHAEAVPMLRESLAAYTAVYGNTHLNTWGTSKTLATALGALGKHTEAEALFNRVAAAQERTLGKEHQETMNTKAYLAGFLFSAGKHREAVPLLRNALAALRRAHGDGHVDTMNTASNLGAALLHLPDGGAEAEVVARDVLAVRKRVLGDGHRDTMCAHLLVAEAAEARRAQESRLEQLEMELFGMLVTKGMLGAVTTDSEDDSDDDSDDSACTPRTV